MKLEVSLKICYRNVTPVYLNVGMELPINQVMFIIYYFLTISAFNEKKIHVIYY